MTLRGAVYRVVKAGGCWYVRRDGGDFIGCMSGTGPRDVVWSSRPGARSALRACAAAWFTAPTPAAGAGGGGGGEEGEAQ